MLAARRTERLAALAAEIEREGRRALAVSCDVTRDGDLERTVAAARTTFGGLDVAIANAGFGVVGPVERLTLADYHRQFETNVFGVLRTIHATLRDLRARRGRLVIIGSVSGHLATPGSSPYSMSKFAVRSLAEALGHEVARDGVSVTHVSPGFVESEIGQVDNRGVWRAQAPRRPLPASIVMATPTAARKIVGAVARRRREAVITGFGKAAVVLQRHLPWLSAAIIRRFGIKGRREPR